MDNGRIGTGKRIEKREENRRMTGVWTVARQYRNLCTVIVKMGINYEGVKGREPQDTLSGGVGKGAAR